MIIDLDTKLSSGQQTLVKKYYTHYIPHVVVLNAKGSPIYNQAGEVGESEIARILDELLKTGGH